MVASTAALARRGAWTNAGFALAFSVVLGIVAATVWAFDQHAKAARLVAHTEQVRAALAEARWALSDLRAHALASFLQPATSNASETTTPLRARLAAVHDLTVDNPGQQARLAEVGSELDTLDAHLQALPHAAAQSSATVERDRAAMETDRQLRALNTRLVALDAEEQGLLSARIRASDQRFEWLAWAIRVLLVVLGALLPLLYVNVRRWQKHEDALLRAEQRLHLMAQNVTDYAIIMLDASGRVLSWNVGAERLKGWSRDEAVGQHFSRFYTAEDVAAGKPQIALERAGIEGRHEDEGWRVRKDGTRFWASAVITALREPGGGTCGFLKITRDLTQRRQAEEALRTEIAQTHDAERRLAEANESLETLVAARTAELTAANVHLEDARGRLQQLSNHLIESQEEERRRISRELHDETGQALTGIKLRLSAGMRDGALAPRGIEECVTMVDGAIRHIRQLSLDLRPLVLDDLGLADAVEAMLQRMGESAGWTTTLNADDLPGALDPAVETACFRIVQEALTNAARHAGAQAVDVRLQRVDGELTVTIRDDGNGFDPASMRNKSVRRAHFGLVSMGERASLAGGTLDVHASSGHGTTVRVVFPLGVRNPAPAASAACVAPAA